MRVDGLPDVQIDVLPDDTVLDTVQEAVGFKPRRILLGSRLVEEGTFADAGIEDLATLTVVGQRVATAVEVVDKLMELNPGVTRDQLTKYLKLEEDGVTVEYWYLDDLGLVEVPEEICDLKFTGDLRLTYDKLVSLPERIGEMQIGGTLALSHNKLVSLPERIGEMQIGRTLDLSFNGITTLPQNIGGMRIGRHLSLSSNQITTVPPTMAEITVGGSLFLSANPMGTTVPACLRGTGIKVYVR